LYDVPSSLVIMLLPHSLGLFARRRLLGIRIPQVPISLEYLS
jgi:hypothetical protein